jgi:prevent-host-death family protein
MTAYNVHEAKTHFSKLLQRALDGEEVVIAKAGKPVARVVPYEQPAPAKPRVPGAWKGKVWIADDFDDELPEEIAAAFRGERP